MSFDAGQFFNNLFSKIGNIKDTNINRSGKTDGYNFHEETKILPDETPDKEIIASSKMLMYAVPNFDEDNNKVSDELKRAYKYAVPDMPEGEPEESIKKYAVPNPDISVEKYGIPNPEPTPQPTVEEQPQNPWEFNFSQFFSNLFGNGNTSFIQRLNNIFSNIFSRWK